MVDASLPKTLTLISHFQSKSLPIVYTQHGHTEDELSGRTKNQLVNRWGPSGSIARYTSEWELIPEIKKHVGDAPVIQKNTYDAFINTDLEQTLHDRKVERVVVCGVMTDCCCDTSARSAFNRGFETWLASDACGTATKKQHESGLNGFGYAFGDVLTTEKITKQIS
ncbi:MAG: hypothetical protein Q9227_008368 [Pyrenula ochraceoflavens]